MALKLALSYSGLLIVCLLLVCALYFSTVRHARAQFWDHEFSAFDTAAAIAQRDLDQADSYTRMLVTDSTLVRLSNTTRGDMTDLVMTADSVMKRLLIRSSSLLGRPLSTPHIYLSKSGYVISDSQFTEMESFYKKYQSYEEKAYADWLDILENAGDTLRFFDASPFTGLHGDVFAARRVQSAVKLPGRAVIWFVVDVSSLRTLLLPDGSQDAALLLYHRETGDGLMLTRDGVYCPGSEGYLDRLPRLFSVQAQGEQREHEGRMLLSRETAAGWVWQLSQPAAMANIAQGSRMNALFAAVILLALSLGAALIVKVVRLYMRPLRRLSTQLSQAENDNAELQQEIDAHRPLMCADYLRQLTSGHITTEDEFAYMMAFLGLEGEHQFFVLYCVVHSQSGGTEAQTAPDAALMEETLRRYLTGSHAAHFYRTLSGSYVVLCAYEMEEKEPLMDLQRRIVEMHEYLVDHHGLWFYAGVGCRCTQPQQLWESYEQARTAARYTARHYTFLPYEMIRKDTDSWYYPIEISAKLQHFITSGNREQVVEMFALIHRENIVERALPMPLLNLLLSDLKNTLLKSRFQLKGPLSGDMTARVRDIDRRLSDTMTFAQLEDAALSLSELFAVAKTSSNPVPEIEKYLRENFSDPALCLSLVAEHFRISASYLSHLFKDKTGENFSVYLENLRLNEAARRLRDKDCNLTTLYETVGYANAASFRRAFKKRFNLTPSEMRGGQEGTAGETE